MAEVLLAASARADTGTSSSRRLRTSGRIPATLYGHGIEPLSLSVDGRELRSALTSESGLNALVNLDLDGSKHLVLARELQKHPVRGAVVHVDFQIVRRDEQVHADVPLSFVGEAPKVTKAGGVVEYLLNTLSIVATPATMPAHIEVDISELDLENPIRVQDLPLPKGVVASVDGEEAVVTGNVQTVVLSPEEEGASEATEATADATKPSSDENTKA